MSFKQTLSALVLGLGLTYAAGNAVAQESPKPRVEADSGNFIGAGECIPANKICPEEKKKSSKPAKPSCSSYDGHMCLEDDFATSIGATERKEGLCLGDKYCYKVDHLPKYAELLERYGGNVEKMSKSLEETLILFKEFRGLFDQTFDDETMFALAAMKYECADEYKEITGKLKHQQEMLGLRKEAEKNFLKYTAKLEKEGKKAGSKPFKPADIYREFVKIENPTIDEKELQRKYETFVKADEDYQKAVSDANATIARIRAEGCIEQKVQESTPVKVKIGGNATYDPATNTYGGNGEVQVLAEASESVNVGAYANGGYETSSTTKVHTEQPMPGLEQRTTETETQQRIAGAGAVAELELGAGFSVYIKGGAAWKKVDQERTVESGYDAVTVDKSEKRFVGEAGFGIDWELFENLGINLGGKCDTDEDCSLEGGLYITF